MTQRSYSSSSSMKTKVTQMALVPQLTMGLKDGLLIKETERALKLINKVTVKMAQSNKVHLSRI